MKKLVFFCILREIVILMLSLKLLFYLLLLFFAVGFYFINPAAWHNYVKETFRKAKKLIMPLDDANSNMNYALFCAIIVLCLHQVLPAFLFDILFKLFYSLLNNLFSIIKL